MSSCDSYENATSAALTPSASRVRGACPGVAMPMVTGDGLLLRLRQPLGGLDGGAARTVAEVARRCGNGILELTGRAGLQIRGVSATGLADAQNRLLEAGLGDTDPAREAVRNVMVSPVSDVDPAATADVTGLAREVALALTAEANLRDLPPKVSVVVDGGGVAHFADVAADLRLTAVREEAGWGRPIHYDLAGGGTARTAVPLARFEAAEAPGAVVRVLGHFLALRARAGNPPGRMAEALQRWGLDPFIGGLNGSPTARRPLPRPPVSWTDILGPVRSGAWRGLAFPFGELTAGQLEALVDSLDEPGLAGAGGRLRLTPWRAVLLTQLDDKSDFGTRPEGAVDDPSDPRLAAGACIGTKGCLSGTTAAREDARALTGVAPNLVATGGRIQVVGCKKGCGAPQRSTLTLTAEAGRYSIVLAGGVAEPPVWAGLTLAAARRYVAALDRVIAGQLRAEEGPDATITRLGIETVKSLTEAEVRGV